MEKAEKIQNNRRRPRHLRPLPLRDYCHDYYGANLVLVQFHCLVGLFFPKFKRMSSKLPSQMRMLYPYPTGRQPQDVDRVSVKISKEFKLRDRVTNATKNKKTPCLFELSLVLSCLSENGFNDKICVDQVDGLRSCYRNALNAEEALKHRRINPKKLEHSDNLIAAEINTMFKFYK